MSDGNTKLPYQYVPRSSVAQRRQKFVCHSCNDPHLGCSRSQRLAAGGHFQGPHIASTQHMEKAEEHWRALCATQGQVWGRHPSGQGAPGRKQSQTAPGCRGQREKSVPSPPHALPLFCSWEEKDFSLSSWSAEGDCRSTLRSRETAPFPSE